MKQQKENKLHLGKETVQNFRDVLDSEALHQVYGGSIDPSPNTDVPQYC